MNSRRGSTSSPIGTRHGPVFQPLCLAGPTFVSQISTFMSQTTKGAYTSRLRTSRACLSMKSRRGSTLSPMRTRNMSSRVRQKPSFLSNDAGPKCSQQTGTQTRRYLLQHLLVVPRPGLPVATRPENAIELRLCRLQPTPSGSGVTRASRDRSLGCVRQTCLQAVGIPLPTVNNSARERTLSRVRDIAGQARRKTVGQAISVLPCDSIRLLRYRATQDLDK